MIPAEPTAKPAALRNCLLVCLCIYLFLSTSATGKLSLRGLFLEFRKEIPEYRVSIDVINCSDHVSGVVETERVIIRHYRTVHQIGRQPTVVDDPGNRRHVPQHLRPCKMIFSVSLEDVEQVIADRASASHVSLHLRNRCPEMRHDGSTRQLHEGYAGIEDDSGRIQILLEVEFSASIELGVVQTDPGFKGNTAQNATKPAILSTGTKINVPLFIEVGNIVRVDTRTGEYLERVNK